MSKPAEPSRGDVWDLSLDPTLGHEQSGTRPALVVSVDIFNAGLADLVVVIPITRTQRRVRWHVAAGPPEGGLVSEGFIQCENVRSVSKMRFKRLRGRVAASTMMQVEDRLRILMGL